MEITVENFNNKLGCDSFIIISSSPKEKKIASDFPMPIIVIDKISKERHVCQLVSFIRFSSNFIPNHISYLSHNMESDDLLASLKISKGVSSAKELAVYLYTKIK